MIILVPVEVRSTAYIQRLGSRRNCQSSEDSYHRWSAGRRRRYISLYPGECEYRSPPCRSRRYVWVSFRVLIGKQVAYFAAIPKSDLAKSEVIVAGLFFRNVFGNSAGARSLPAFVSLSNLGNVLAVSFSHARVNQGIFMYDFSHEYRLVTVSLYQNWQKKVCCLGVASGLPTSPSIPQRHQ